MMKNVLLFLLPFLLLACGTPSYRVLGTVTDPQLEGRIVTLIDNPDDKALVFASDRAQIIDGKFEFEGTLSSATSFKQLRVDGVDHVRFVLEEGAVNIYLDSLSVVGGTALNEAYQKIVDKARDVHGTKIVLNHTISKFGDDADETRNVRIEYGKVLQSYTNEVEQFTDLNINNKVGVSMLANFYTEFPLDRVEQWLNSVPSELYDDVRAIRNIVKVDKEMLVGVKYKEGNVYNVAGKAKLLSDYIPADKSVLLVFWASWCQPYIKDISTLETIYAKYKARGFEVIAISIDRKAVKWQESLDEHPSSWIQLRSKELSMENEYGLYYYPHTLLFDKEGRLVAKDLRGDLLDSELDSLLK